MSIALVVPVVSTYHLNELRIALDPMHKANALPPPRAAREKVLDIGCGAGQTLVAAYPDRQCFGLDVDFQALQLGNTLTKRISFVCGRAESLPYRDECFDFVIARVSLPYTDIGRALREIRRVLKDGGDLWLTLHPLSIPWRNAKQSRSLKASMFFLYTVLNGVLFHFLQKQFSCFGRFESFQTAYGMSRCLHRSGFRVTLVSKGYAFLMTARAAKVLVKERG